MTNTRSLASIEKDFMADLKKDVAREKATILSAIKRGRLMHEASLSPELPHGTLMDWAEEKFDLSYQTLLNYRNVHDLCASSAEIENDLKSGKLNLSLNAVYMIAAMKKPDQQELRNSIIEKARAGQRFSHSRIRLMIARMNARGETPPIPAVEVEVEPDDHPWNAELNPEEDEDEDESAAPEATPPALPPKLPPPAPPRPLKPPPKPSPKKPEPRPPSGEGRLYRTMLYLENVRASNEEWPDIVKRMGPVRLRRIIADMEAAIDKHAPRTAVEKAADKAASPASRKMNGQI